MFAWLVSCQALAPDYFEDIRSGKVSTFTDERFTKAMNVMKEWGEAGYYEDNYDGTTYTAQTPVSYTHLDVYKRQRHTRALSRSILLIG